jgi:hypothetical protein
MWSDTGSDNAGHSKRMVRREKTLRPQSGKTVVVSEIILPDEYLSTKIYIYAVSAEFLREK